MRSFRLCVLLLAGYGLCAAPVLGQTTITYTSGTTDSTSYSTSPPDDPLTLSIASGTATQSGALTGTGGIIKAGAGDLTLSGSNSYSGGTVLNEGTLRIGGYDSLGAGVLTINGGTLGNEIGGGNVGLDNLVTVNGDFSVDVQAVGNVLDFFSNVDMGTDRTVTFTGDGIACFEGGVSGHNITFLTGGEPADVTFCSISDNTFTGTLRIGDGVNLELWKQGDFDDPPVIAISGDLQIDAGATAILVTAEQFAATSNVEVNGTLLGLSASQNTINALSGTGSIIGVNGDTLAVNSGTFSGSIAEDQAIVKQGAGTLALTGSSSYTGGTVVNSGTLRAGHTKALGDGNVAVNDAGVLWVEEGVALDVGTGNAITLENNGIALYRKDFALNEDYANFGEIVSSGSNSTVAEILSGTASAAGSVEASFDDEPTTAASNDEFRVSDVLSLEGLDGDTFVMQLSYSQAAYDAAALAGLYTSETQLLIGYLDGGIWVPVGTGPFVNGAWSGEVALGTYGVDTVNNVVWVVTDHNSEFAVVPEPGTAALLACGVLAWIVRRRR